MSDAPCENTYELITRASVMKMLNFNSSNGFKKFLRNTPDFPLPFPHKKGGRVYYFKIQIMYWLKEKEEQLREEAKLLAEAKIKALEEEKQLREEKELTAKEHQEQAFKESMENAKLAAIKYREKYL